MQIFMYPYVIITVLIMVFVAMGFIGLYFTIKSIKTAKGTVEKNFCSIGKIENDFDKSGAQGKSRCVVYVSVVLDNMKRFYSANKAVKLHEQIKQILLAHFGFNVDGDVSVYDSESFVAINNLNSEENALRINKCAKEIDELCLEYSALNILRVNFGYCSTASSEVSFKTVLSRAKQACSIAENKDTLYCEWDTANGKEFEQKVKIENNIHSEIDNNKFFLEYQPILNAKTNEIIGAEVLSRLNSTTEGILTPGTFLSAVNSVGLNNKFDYYIFEKNCKWISSDKENRMKYVYTINFSRSTLCNPNLADDIIEIIEKYNIDFSCIAIEILEDKNLESTEKAIMMGNLKKLKSKGILILLDDFGKGYANFSDLTDFDIDIVKIDKIITQKANDKSGFLILKNIIKIAQGLGFKTLCEGIETEEQKRIVVEAGCDMLQGYHLYRPMPVIQLEALFKK